MKGINKLTAIVSHDKELWGLMSGLIFSIIGLLGVVVTACVWYL
jgi:uncharacterized membrane protein